MRTPVVFGLLLICASSVQAQVYKCTNAQGKLTFQSTPCGGLAEGRPMKLQVAPAPKRSSSDADEKTWLQEQWEKNAGKRAARKIRAKQRAAEARQQVRFKTLIRQSRVAIGMSKQQVRRSWGSPDKINTTINSSGRSVTNHRDC